MRFEKLLDIVDALNLEDSFYWGSFEYSKKDLTLLSISSFDLQFISKVSFECGLSYASAETMKNTVLETYYYISFY